MEIMDGIHQITLGGGSSGSHPTVSAYYVQGMDYGVFIDAGFPDEERTRPLRDYWRDALGSPKTEWIFVTHRHYEHGGGVKLVKETTGAQVAVGAGDAEAVDADIGQGSKVVDKPLHGDEVFDLGGRHLRTVAPPPGHTLGTFCYLLEEEGILFTGDHIMGQGTVVVRTDEGGRMTEHIDSLRKLLDLDLKTVLSGHGPVMNDPLAKIPDLVRHRLERDEQILGMLREGTNHVDDLVSRIYGETSERLGFLARHQVVAHLKKLEEDGPSRQTRQTLTGRLEHGAASDPTATAS